MEKKDRRPFLVSEAAAENILGKKLSEARKDKKIRQNAFVKLLEEYGISMSSSSYSCWETGARTPNAYQFLALCRALDIQDVMGYFLEEHGNVDGMEQLNPEGQALAQQYIRLLVRSGEYQREPDPDTEILNLDLYLQSASAGCGQFLDDDSRETISLPRSVVPAGTEFVVRISGDSMEPAFYDHQLAFVKRTVDLRPGDLGIFLLDGDGYIKKYEEEMPEEAEMEEYLYSSGDVQKKPVLLSLNPKYDPIRVTQNNEFQIIGKVLNRNGLDFNG